MPSALTGPAPSLSLPGKREKVDPCRVSHLFYPLDAEEGSLRLGVPALDDALQGSLACGALHELTPASELQLGSAFGFGLAIAALAAAGGDRQGPCLPARSGAPAAPAPFGPPA